MKEIALTVEYGELAKIIGVAAAEKTLSEGHCKGKKRSEIKQLREKLLEIPAEDVATAYLNSIALECGVFDIEQPTEPVRRAEWIIFRIMELEKEI